MTSFNTNFYPNIPKDITSKNHHIEDKGFSIRIGAMKPKKEPVSSQAFLDGNT